MDIKQILRDAIDSKVAEILKEEYGIEPPKLLNNAGVTAHVEKIGCDDDPLDWTPIPSDEQGKDPNYQVTLLDSGEDYEGVIDFIASKVQADPTYANALVDHAPSVIITGLCKEAAVDISNELAKLGAGSSVESVIPTGTTSKHVYQLVLTNRSSGVHREDIANIVEQIEGSKSYADFVLTSNAPLVIARGLNYFTAVELKKSIVDKGGDVAIEEITKID